MQREEWAGQVEVSMLLQKGRRGVTKEKTDVLPGRVWTWLLQFARCPGLMGLNTQSPVGGDVLGGDGMQ